MQFFKAATKIMQEHYVGGKHWAGILFHALFTIQAQEIAI